MEAELNSAPEPESLSLDDEWKRMETAIRKVVENTIGYTQKQAKNTCGSTRSAKWLTRRRTLSRSVIIQKNTRATNTAYNKPSQKTEELI
jgi:hypothetical protein